MNDSYGSLLGRGMEALGIDVSLGLDTLLRYVAEIEFFNDRYGLVNASGEELVIKHILDSLAGLSAIRARKPRSLADAGSGAGLPGIPLAIMMPETQVSLIERSGKRVGFLRSAVASLGLKNVEIVAEEAERVQGRYELLTFRAFRPLEPKLVKALLGLLAPGGCIAAYKGKREKIDEEMRGLTGLNWEALPLEVPFLDEERHLVIIRG